jgi:hypothetical protein
MADIVLSEADGAMRAAATALRTNAGCVARLRVPGLAASGDATEELGLATPLFQELPLGPAAFSRTASGTRLTVSAAAVLALVQTFACDSAETVFETAAGVLIEDELYLIANIASAESHGRPYSYTLTLQPPTR